MPNTNPFQILAPSERWTPSQEQLDASALEKLLPPLVHKIRLDVAEWRDAGYIGVSDASRSLLRFWFGQEHENGFQFFFSQREAIESIIYLYEVAKARDKHAMIRFANMGNVSANMFEENWTRYVVKMATGAGKTKVAALVVVWSYFHKLYETDSPLSKNFLIIAPNIIVLNRLKKDFVDLKMFFDEPFLPADGFDDREWQTDFQLTLHIQDELKTISDEGNIFLTNVHRIFFNPEPVVTNEERFLGASVNTNADKSKGVDLGELLRGQKIQDLVVINDEAHHVHDSALAWFKNIQDIHTKLKYKNGVGLALQADFSATPKHNKGGIFVQTISDYPLVEAINQGVVKSPVLPDAESRAKLHETDSDDFEERYSDFIKLGYIEWQKQTAEFSALGKTPILFVMTMSTDEADKAAAFLEREYAPMKGKVLVIHTNKAGEISDKSKKDKEELEILRKAADTIDAEDSPYRAVVSVLMLREGWDVRNVTTIVGLRPYGADSKILPEQTIGRGLRKMLPIGTNEKLVIVGTKNFLDFVESLKSEGVSFEYKKMGDGMRKEKPIIVEVGDEQQKDVEALDIPIPILSPKIYKEYKNLALIDTQAFRFAKAPFVYFNSNKIVEIVFEDIDGKPSHTTIFDPSSPDYRNVLAFLTNGILHGSRLFTGFDVLYPKVKYFIEQQLFGMSVSLDTPDVVRNLAQSVAKTTLFKVFKDAINDLTTQEHSEVKILRYASLRETKPKVLQTKNYIISEKCLLTYVVCDNGFERKMAETLHRLKDVTAFAKNGIGGEDGNLSIEYQKTNGHLARYYPDFLIKTAPNTFFILETKGREDLNDLAKIKRLVQWCKDVNALQNERTYTPLYVQQEKWDNLRQELQTFEELKTIFAIKDDKQLEL